MNNVARFLALSVLLAFLPAPVRADELPAPEGRVLLTVTGKIARTNANGAARLDAAALRKVGWTSIGSYTAWTEGKRRFAGVPLAALLKHVGASGKSLRAVALNDYKADVPVADASKYKVILAMEMDGKRMRVRDKGPIWIIYPADEPQDEKHGKHNHKMVWQLKTLNVR